MGSVAAFHAVLWVVAASAWPDLGWWSPLGVLVGTLMLAGRRRRPVAIAVAAVLALSVVPVVFTAVIGLHTVGRVKGARTCVGVMAAVAVIVGVTQVLEDGVVGLGRSALITAALGAPLLFGAYRRTRAALAVEQAARRAGEQAERDRMVAAAVQAERRHLARELHDAVAHSVAVMTMRAGALEMIDDATAPTDVAAEAATIARLGRQALDELRAMLGVLRDDEATPTAPLPTVESIPTLTEQATNVGLDVDLHISGDPTYLDPQLSRACYRLVQEGLTNCAKHAPGAPVRVEVSVHPDGITAAVVNPGPARPGADHRGTGLGIAGLRERARLIGATVAAGRAADGGWELSLSTPPR